MRKEKKEEKKQIDTKISNEEFEKCIDQIFTYMKEKLLKKNKAYGSASFEGGRMAVIGNAFRQRDKSNRQMYLIKTLIEEGKSDKPFGESLWDTICDQFGYATIGLSLLMILEEQGDDFKEFFLKEYSASEWMNAFRESNKKFYDHGELKDNEVSVPKEDFPFGFDPEKESKEE